MRPGNFGSHIQSNWTFAQALGADRTGAEILPEILTCRLGPLDQLVDQNADRPLGKIRRD